MYVRSPLGADETPLTEEEYRRRMLEVTEEQAARSRRWQEHDQQARMLNLVAIMTIPVVGTLWKWFWDRRKK